MLSLQGAPVRELRSFKLWDLAKDKKERKRKKNKQKTQKLNDMISVFLGSMTSYVRNYSSQMTAEGGGEGETLVNFVLNGYLQDY